VNSSPAGRKPLKTDAIRIPWLPNGDVEDAVNRFFCSLLDCRLLFSLRTVAEVLNDGGGIPLLCGR
jgi:hypothetical protein